MNALKNNPLTFTSIIFTKFIVPVINFKNHCKVCTTNRNQYKLKYNKNSISDQVTCKLWFVKKNHKSNTTLKLYKIYHHTSGIHVYITISIQKYTEFTHKL